MRSRNLLSRLLRGGDYRHRDNIDLREIRIPDSIIELVPESVARENGVLPVDFDGETITCVTDSDTDVMMQDKLRFLLNCNVKFIWCDRSDVFAAINQYYGQVEGESADSMLQEFTDTSIDFCETALEDESQIAAYVGKLESASTEGLRSRFRRKNARQLRSFQPKPNGNEGFMFYTVPEGKRVLANRRDGRIEVLKGPCRVWKFGTRFEKMRRYIAHPGQYLSIRYCDGREQTELGPTEIWGDPREHQSIEVKDCLDLAAKEAVVVYNADNGESAETSRRVFYGPGLFVPQPGEWLHRFSWHASRGGSRGEEKRPNALQFEKLCLMPDQMYHDVRDVRTADDAVLTIRLMIFFELVDIDRMLDTTRDPIGDFINAATSDVVEFTGKRSFEQFKQETKDLNEIETYAQLLHRASQCGYRINNVVYRGYGAPDSLQSMHDEAIQTRTRLRLERATEEQAQDVEDYKLKCQMDRAERRRTEQINEIQHDLETKRQQAVAGLKQREAQEAFDREQKRASAELEMELQARRDEQQQSHLQSLQGMQVDLTEFLTQSRADQVIEVRGQANMRPQLHLNNGKKQPK